MPPAVVVDAMIASAWLGRRDSPRRTRWQPSLENLTMRLAACRDGDLDPLDAFSQIAYLHEKAERAEIAARDIREAIERVSGWDQPAPNE